MAGLMTRCSGWPPLMLTYAASFTILALAAQSSMLTHFASSTNPALNMTCTDAFGT